MGHPHLSRLPDSGKFTDSYVSVNGGKKIKKDISGAGSRTEVFAGDYIKSCTVQKNPDNRERIQLIVSEDNKMIFDSGKMETNTPIVYERKSKAGSAAPRL